MKTIAIIPARAGSKRILKKNIKLFCGKPIIEYSISAALSSGLFGEVMVSTDSEEIATLAQELGAKVPFMRSEKTSTDTATTSEVLLEVLEQYRNNGIDFNLFSCIYPTAPFLTPEKLSAAMKMFIESGCDSLIPVVRFSYPPQRGLVIVDKLVRMRHPEQIDARSQDLEPIYHDCGQFYFCKVTPFFEQKSFFTNSTTPYILSELQVQDIDNEEDWEIAEIKFQLMR